MSKWHKLSCPTAIYQNRNSFSPWRVNLPSLSVYLHSSPGEQVQNTKFLGVCINNTLTWREHVQQVSSTVSRNLNLLRQLSWFLPKSALLAFYRSYILHPTIVMWCGAAAQKRRDCPWNACRTLQHGLASTGSAHLPLPRTNFGKKAFSYRGAAMWNSLPSHAHNTSTISAFNSVAHPILLTTS